LKVTVSNLSGLGPTAPTLRADEDLDHVRRPRERVEALPEPLLGQDDPAEEERYLPPVEG
jgi:hypothetical protein